MIFYRENIVFSQLFIGVDDKTTDLVNINGSLAKYVKKWRHYKNRCCHIFEHKSVPCMNYFVLGTQLIKCKFYQEIT